MKILTVPQNTAILRTKSSLIQEVTPEVIKFLRELGDTLKNQHNPQGVGLSAIQVGRPMRVFATWLPTAKAEGQRMKDEGRKKIIPELLFYLNPELIDHSPDTTLGEDLVQESGKRKAESGKRDFESSSPTLLRAELGTKAYPLPPKPFLEGCLSIPSIYGPVPRWSWIKARAIVFSESDVSSSRFPASPTGGSLHASRFTLEKLAARVFQHELDHLNGILFTDRTLEAGLQIYRQKEKELLEMEM